MNLFWKECVLKCVIVFAKTFKVNMSYSWKDYLISLYVILLISIFMNSKYYVADVLGCDTVAMKMVKLHDFKLLWLIFSP